MTLIVLKKYKIQPILVAFLSLSFLFGSSFYRHKDDPKRKVKTIVIDAGHGGKDPGCSGHIHNEKTVALAVALKLGKLIEDNMKDVKVIFTRKSDVFVDLEDRAKIANDNNADLFISIHCNAAGKPVMIKDKKTGKMRAKTYKNKKGKTVVVETTNPEPYGSETYVMGLKNEVGQMKVAQRENSAILLEDNYETKYQGFDPDSEESYIIMSNYTSGYVIQSAGLAIKIQDEYSKKAGRVDKGVHRQSIWVLWRTAMPSILTEIGYLTNPQEEKFLGSEKGQDYMASCLFRSFRKYKDEQEGTKKSYNDELENQKALEKEVYVQVKDTMEQPVLIDTSAGSITKPEEPKDVIVKKDSIKGDTKTLTELENEKKYKQFIVLADMNFKKKNYTEAQGLYELADKVKPKGDNYPQDKLKDIKAITQKTEKDNQDKLAQDKLKAKEDSIKAVKAIKTSTVAVMTPTKTVVADNGAIQFKVQFASNDKEVDAKLKYPNVSDVSFYKAGVVFKYTSGAYNTFEDASKQQTKLRELGYKDCFVVAFKNGARMDITEARKTVEGKR